MNNELIIKSKIDNIYFVENFIDELAIEQSIATEMYGNILISTIEAVTNAIVHGNNSDPAKVVHIKVLRENKTLQITVTDEGEGFDITVVPDPTRPDHIEQPDGRGIFLMRNLADDLQFAKNGAEVTLIFNL